MQGDQGTYVDHRCSLAGGGRMTSFAVAGDPGGGKGPRFAGVSSLYPWVGALLPLTHFFRDHTGLPEGIAGLAVKVFLGTSGAVARWLTRRNVCQPCPAQAGRFYQTSVSSALITTAVQNIGSRVSRNPGGLQNIVPRAALSGLPNSCRPPSARRRVRCNVKPPGQSRSSRSSRRFSRHRIWPAVSGAS